MIAIILFNAIPNCQLILIFLFRTSFLGLLLNSATLSKTGHPSDNFSLLTV